MAEKIASAPPFVAMMLFSVKVFDFTAWRVFAHEKIVPRSSLNPPKPPAPLMALPMVGEYFLYSSTTKLGGLCRGSDTLKSMISLSGSDIRDNR